MSPGLKAAEALIDAAVAYDRNVLNDKAALIYKVLKAVNSVLSDSVQYKKDGIRLKPWLDKYMEKIV